ncbi:hypothetical protein [Burkholderia gladioli]|uniref:hypothetical protein n=1 Tax=Burkholderia gladioli TaxID=28095 RepID=UPI001641E587|nr:hypothetical protein [Burkholderia gladioli]
MTGIDYHYWASLDKWNKKEAALLIDGKDPRSHKEISLRAREIPAGYEHAAKIAAILDRADWAARYGATAWQVGSNPLYIIDVIRSAGIEVPQPLLVEIKKRQAREAEAEARSKAAQEEDEGNSQRNASAATKERHAMLKLIIGFAYGGYRMDPDSPRNKHAKEMRIDLERAGVPLDDETIKKYLDEAKQLRRSILARRGTP